MRKNILLLCCLVLVSRNVIASDFRFSPRPNNAHLIQWRAWGPAALDEAKKKNRLVLLSLSAVWCHWCHVMDETTYSDAGIIAYINEHFIPVRVDADLRPDIDALYNQGGWPSTAILTPEGEVVSGGNYIPPDEMLARLKRAATLFSDDRGIIDKRLGELKALKQLREMQQGGIRSSPDTSELDRVVQVLKNSFDEINGGFGGGQKFPNPDAIDFLLSLYARSPDKGIKKIVTKTLDRMAKGGIFDKVEGGFFRYATKPDWSGPHYEKMLEVNAGAIRNYAHASMAFGSREYRNVVRECLRYVRAALYDPASGAFYGSQDADERYYEKQDRKGVKAPFIDKTVYADSSSLMVSALLSAYQTTGEKQYLDMAVRCVDFMVRNMVAGDEGVFHSFREGEPSLKGLLSDNALFGSALLDLYNATGEKRYFEQANGIGGMIVGRYYDAETKRFRSNLDASLVKPATAGALSDANNNLANYRAIRFLGRLVYTGDDMKLKEARDAALASLSGEYRKFTPHAGIYGTALLWIAVEPVQITILAEGDGARRYLSAINSVYVPEKVMRVLSLSDDAAVIKALKYPLQEAVYLCAGKRCSAQITKPDKLNAELKRFISALR
jgi:uncharacterized protein YyaL (SSP411 family)